VKIAITAVLVLCGLGLGVFFLQKPVPPVETKAIQPLQQVDVAALRHKAQAGDPAAQTALGKLLQEGTQTKANIKESLKWYQLAADQNYPDALAALGEMTQAGQGIAQNLEEAVRLYKLAADKGSVAGQYDLAYLYEQGSGVEKDETQAAKWYQLAAEGGDAIAQFDIGQRYMLGVGVSKNLIEAYKWLSLAAAQGQADSAKLLVELKRELSAKDLADASQHAKAFVPRNAKPSS
jgi:uncharacterized protein